MDPLTIGLVGSGLLGGFLGNQAKDRQQQKSAELRAAEIRASPWTKMAPSTQIDFNGGNAAGSMIQGGIGGLQQGQAIGQASQQNDLMKQWLKAKQPSLMGAQTAMMGAPVPNQFD
jgi:hypothetical protein